MNRLAVLAVALLASSVSHADTDPAAAARLKAGHEHFGAGRFSDALVEYHAAYKLDPDPDTLFAIAQTERKLGQCHLALPHYREYLASRSDFPNEVKGVIAECWMQLPPPEGNKPCPSAPSVESGLPWYKNPASGAVLAGTVSFAVGVGFLFASSSTRDQADSAQFSDDFDRLLDEATGERRIGVTFLITGALLAGGGVAYYFVTKPRSQQPTTAVTTDGRSILFARTF
ncbi:MAG: tetratricopeptide repeat protein [Kofleriaceae bacterium]